MDLKCYLIVSLLLIQITCRVKSDDMDGIMTRGIVPDCGFDELPTEESDLNSEKYQSLTVDLFEFENEIEFKKKASELSTTEFDDNLLITSTKLTNDKDLPLINDHKQSTNPSLLIKEESTIDQTATSQTNHAMNVEPFSTAKNPTNPTDSEIIKPIATEQSIKYKIASTTMLTPSESRSTLKSDSVEQEKSKTLLLSTLTPTSGQYEVSTESFLESSKMSQTNRQWINSTGTDLSTHEIIEMTTEKSDSVSEKSIVEVTLNRTENQQKSETTTRKEAQSTESNYSVTSPRTMLTENFSTTQIFHEITTNHDLNVGIFNVTANMDEPSLPSNSETTNFVNNEQSTVPETFSTITTLKPKDSRSTSKFDSFEPEKSETSSRPPVTDETIPESSSEYSLIKDTTNETNNQQKSETTARIETQSTDLNYSTQTESNYSVTSPRTMLTENFSTTQIFHEITTNHDLNVGISNFTANMDETSLPSKITNSVTDEQPTSQEIFSTITTLTPKDTRSTSKFDSFESEQPETSSRMPMTDETISERSSESSVLEDTTSETKNQQKSETTAISIKNHETTISKSTETQFDQPANSFRSTFLDNFSTTQIFEEMTTEHETNFEPTRVTSSSDTQNLTINNSSSVEITTTTLTIDTSSPSDSVNMSLSTVQSENSTEISVEDPKTEKTTTKTTTEATTNYETTSKKLEKSINQTNDDIEISQTGNVSETTTTSLYWTEQSTETNGITENPFNHSVTSDQTTMKENTAQETVSEQIGIIKTTKNFPDETESTASEVWTTTEMSTFKDITTENEIIASTRQSTSSTILEITSTLTSTPSNLITDSSATESTSYETSSTTESTTFQEKTETIRTTKNSFEPTKLESLSTESTSISLSTDVTTIRSSSESESSVSVEDFSDQPLTSTSTVLLTTEPAETVTTEAAKSITTSSVNDVNLSTINSLPVQVTTQSFLDSSENSTLETQPSTLLTTDTEQSADFHETSVTDEMITSITTKEDNSTTSVTISHDHQTTKIPDEDNYNETNGNSTEEIASTIKEFTEEPCDCSDDGDLPECGDDGLPIPEKLTFNMFMAKVGSILTSSENIKYIALGSVIGFLCIGLTWKVYLIKRRRRLAALRNYKLTYNDLYDVSETTKQWLKDNSYISSVL